MGPRLTIVCDDFFGAKTGFHTSYGFALLIEMGGRSILFDTGTKPDALLDNLQAHGTAAQDLDAVVLSHNHYDHTDGLPGILAQNPDLPVYIHRSWDEPHSFKSFVVPDGNRVVVDSGSARPDLPDGLEVTGCYHSNDYGGIYEQACRITTASRQVLITGCCHPGLDAFIDEMAPQPQPLFIMGGFHGFRFTDERAAVVGERLQRIICCHCTGHYEVFASQFGDKCGRIPVGETIELER